MELYKYRYCYYYVTAIIILLSVIQEDLVRQVLEEIRALYEQNQRDV